MARQINSKKRGITLVEILASSLILAVSLTAAIKLFAFSMTLVEKTGDEGIAYNIARRALENTRQKGFKYQNLPDGSTTLYYDSLGNNQASASFTGAKFKLVQSVSSDKMATLPTGTVPADNALRAVVIQVYRLPENELLQTTGTYLARGGI